MIDMILDWKDSKDFIEQYGMDEFVNTLERHFKKNFFSCSTAWMDDPKYTCKLKGSKGDIIIKMEVE